jgi:glycosyltransferase involved in cell wall biosynthesis
LTEAHALNSWTPMLVEDLEQLVSRHPETAVLGHLELPKAATSIDRPGFFLIGWAFGTSVPITAVELVRECEGFRRLLPDQSRPDVASAFPGAHGAAASGFRALVSVAGLESLDLLVRAVLADGNHVPLGRLRLKRAPQVHGKRPPLVSVIIPCFKQAHYLGEAIESALQQTYGNLEIVVVDDGSPDNILEVARRYPGVVLVRQENRGLADARNAGLEASRGEYIVFLDADDRLLPRAVELAVRELQANPDCGFVFGRFERIATDGSPLPTFGFRAYGDDQYRDLLSGNHIAMHATVTYRRSALDEAGGFSTSLPHGCEDYDLYLRIARRRSVKGFDEVVAEYRMHGLSMSTDPAVMLRSSLAALGSQRWTALRNRSYRNAYRTGRRGWREFYGRQLASQMHVDLTSGERSRALRSMLLLARLAPTIALDSALRPRVRSSAQG